MKHFGHHISFLLACNLLTVALFGAPKFEINVQSFPTQQQINSADHLKLQGCTKNELSSSQQNIDFSLKDKKSIKSFAVFIQAIHTQIVFKKRILQDNIIISSAVQSALKKLIFPFHTFW